jgi:hypothetical protein
MFHQARHVFVNQMESAQADRNQQSRLQQLKQRDQTNKPVIAGFHVEL